MERKHSRPTTAKEATAIRERLVNDGEYLAAIVEAVKEFEEGKSKTLEDIDMTRQKRKQKSGE